MANKIYINTDNTDGAAVWEQLVLWSQFGIADNDPLQVDGTPNAAEYARFTDNGLEGRTEAEFKADFNLEIGTDVLAPNGDGSALTGLTANQVSISDAGGYFTGSDVEAALQELGAAGGGGGQYRLNMWELASGGGWQFMSDDDTGGPMYDLLGLE